MNNFQREQIWQLRKRGLGYGTVAKAVGLPKESVKKFCKRHLELRGYGELSKLMLEERVNNGTHCKQCYQPMLVKVKGRPKKFCSDRCRKNFWDSHFTNHDISKTAYEEMTCQNCGRSFFSYANPSRKFCGHPCYIDYRFRKGVVHDNSTKYGN